MKKHFKNQKGAYRFMVATLPTDEQRAAYSQMIVALRTETVDESKISKMNYVLLEPGDIPIFAEDESAAATIRKLI